MNRSNVMIVLIALFMLGTLCAPTSLKRGAYAQNQLRQAAPRSTQELIVNRQRRDTGDDENAPFELNSVVWRNKRAFIENNGRCATQTVDDLDARDIQRRLEQFNEMRARNGAHISRAQVETATTIIAIYFHKNFAHDHKLIFFA